MTDFFRWNGREGEVDSVAGDPPRRHPVARVVGPHQLLADLRQMPVDDQRVLHRSGAVGPLPTDLDADHLAVGAAGPRAPVPVHRVRPASAPVVERRPRLPVGHVRDDAVDTNGPGGGPSDVLDGVLEQSIGPRHDDTETLVALRSLSKDVDLHTLAARPQPRPAVDLVDIDPYFPGAGSNRTLTEIGRQGRGAGQPDGVVCDRFPACPVEQPDTVHRCVVDVGHHERGHMGRGGRPPSTPTACCVPSPPCRGRYRRW